MILSLVIKSVINNKKRAVSVFICLFLSSILFISSVIVHKAVKNSQVDSIKYEIAAENFSLKLKNKSELEKVSSLKGIEKIAVSNYIDSSGLDYKTPFNLSHVDENYVKLNELELDLGRMPQNKNEIALERWVLKNINPELKLGDKVNFDLYNNGNEVSKEFEVVGILKDSPATKLRGIQQIFSFNENYKNDFKNNRYSLIVNKKYIKDFDKKLESIGIDSKMIGKNTMLNDAILSNNYFSVLCVLLIISILNVYILYAVYSIYIVERSKEYGTYIAIGMSKKDIFRMSFLEMFFVQIIAMISACTVVLLMYGNILPEIVRSLSTEINIKKVRMDIDLKSIFSIVGLSLLNLFIIAKLYTRKIFMYSNIDLLNGSIENVSSSISFESQISISSKLFLSYVYRYRKKLISVMLALAISSSLIIFSGYYLREEDEQNKYSAELNKNGVDYGISIMPSENLAYGFRDEDIAKIENLVDRDGKSLVKKVEKVNSIYSRLHTDKGSFSDEKYIEEKGGSGYYKSVLGGVVGKDDKHSFLKISALGYNEELINDLEKYTIDGSFDGEDGIILYNPIINDKPLLNLKSGDTISLDIPKYEDVDIETYFKGAKTETKTVNLKISAVVRNNVYEDGYYVGNDLPQIIMTNSQFKKYFGYDTYRNINLYKRNKGDSKENKYLDKKIYMAFSEYKSVYISDIEKENNEVMSKINIKMTLIKSVAVIIFILGTVNLMNVIINEFFSRINDYSLIEKLGSGRKVLRDISLKEGIFLGSVSGIFGSIIAIVLQVMYYLNIGRYLINPSFKVYFLDYFALISINILIGVVISYFIFSKCRKEIEVLR